MKINEVIVKPVLTEKSTSLVKDNFYTFQVNLRANKHQIKEVIEKLYSVKVDEIKIIIRKGKKRRIGKRQIEKTLPTIKIAIVKLKEGKINIFPQT